jgi:hypothetical protein
MRILLNLLTFEKKQAHHMQRQRIIRGLMLSREPTSCARCDTRRSATAGRVFCFADKGIATVA